MVNIPPEIAPLVERRAKEKNRSIANYIEDLIVAALKAEGLLKEDGSPYVTNPAATPGGQVDPLGPVLKDAADRAGKKTRGGSSKPAASR